MRTFLVSLVMLILFISFVNIAASAGRIKETRCKSEGGVFKFTVGCLKQHKE